jgi:hypothetical protein
MNCPVCSREATARVYWCAKCAALVHVACWPKHKAAAHTETEAKSRMSPYARRGRR